MNRGALLLAELIRTDKNNTCAAIATKIGASESHVYRTSIGERLPGRQQSLGYRDHYNIPVEAWDEPVTATRAPTPAPGDTQPDRSAADSAARDVNEEPSEGDASRSRMEDEAPDPPKPARSPKASAAGASR